MPVWKVHCQSDKETQEEKGVWGSTTSEVLWDTGAQSSGETLGSRRQVFRQQH